MPSWHDRLEAYENASDLPERLREEIERFFLSTTFFSAKKPKILGLGSGGEQNAPLGRAVIGGLTIASLFTLFFVPVVYRLLKRNFKPRELHPRLRSGPEEERHAPASVA
jgi:hypothetical protein